jgi:UDP-N-acetylmuramyl tripeptide synthase
VAAARAGRSALVLNADDPAIADLGRDRPAVTWFGVEDDSMALPEMQHASDAKHCRRCGHVYAYAAVYLGHLGHYRCPNCGRQRPRPDVAAERVELHGVRGATLSLRTPAGPATVSLPLPGLYNAYNALGAATLALALGVDLPTVVAGLERVAAAFGRAETVEVSSRPLSIMLVKNPAGANEVLRTLALEPGQHDVLGVLNDNVADGRDVSWVWDADWEVLATRVRRVTCGGTRAAELALRLKYAGFPPERLHVVPGLEPALDAALADGAGPLYALPTYTALLELQHVLAARGLRRRYWQ